MRVGNRKLQKKKQFTNWTKCVGYLGFCRTLLDDILLGLDLHTF